MPDTDPLGLALFAAPVTERLGLPTELLGLPAPMPVTELLGLPAPVPVTEPLGLPKLPIDFLDLCPCPLAGT